MKILQLCLRVPFPPKDGGAIAMHTLSEGLKNNGAQITVAAVNTPKHYVDCNTLDSEYKNRFNFIWTDIKTKVTPWLIFKNIFSGDSLNISRFYNKHFELKLIELLQKETFDVIQIESLFMACYIDTLKKHSTAKIVLRAHNVEHHIWQSLAKNESNALKSIYLKFLSTRLEKYELATLSKLDAIVSISKEDEAAFRWLGFKKTILTIPSGVNSENFSKTPASFESNSIYHLGSMDWLPNIEGIKWFLNDVWPLVKKKNKEVKLYLAGRKMPEWMLKLNEENVIISGEVEDAIDYQLNKNMLICPVQSGSGIRIKILEAMSLGKIVISTTLGAQGLIFKNGESLLIANSPQEFADAINKCANDKNFCTFISKNARKSIQENYDNNTLSLKLLTFYQSLIKS